MVNVHNDLKIGLDWIVNHILRLIGLIRLKKVPYRYCPLQPMWDLTIHPLRSPASSLAHHLVSDSDTTYNSPCLPLADIVRFDQLFIIVSLTVLKHATNVGSYK